MLKGLLTKVLVFGVICGLSSAHGAQERTASLAGQLASTEQHLGSVWLFIIAWLLCFIIFLLRRIKSLKHEVRRLIDTISKQQKKLTNLTQINSHTRLYKFRYGEQRINDEVAYCLRQNASDQGPIKDEVILFYIILDKSEQLREGYGKHRYMLCQQQFATLLQASFRHTDIISHWQDEEFVVLTRGLKRQQACHLAQRLQHGIQDYSFDCDKGPSLHLTCSQAYIPFPLSLPAEEFDWQQLLLLAKSLAISISYQQAGHWFGLTTATLPTGLSQYQQVLTAISEKQLDYDTSLSTIATIDILLD
ncbi:GGDEF domain-containing protein [Motilimonas pumila]|uniref:Diguanylate cyclase n=1 Tax=Motilimonas pumila TaxID=2303987 RepID=A0A418YFL7_9GAMM|nr:diguanylate cyclase [Motilimonas pumila]RJG48186.1 diguanylate cyclase [Motilimonas pumila]